MVLESVCRLREALLEDCSTVSRIALRGIALGALHGPKQKTFPSYFSNQSPRTYAPKPAYATRYWKERGLEPEPVDVLAVIERRARRYYGHWNEPFGEARLADSRVPEAVHPVVPGAHFNWVITSPPYYGMRTYIPDQWLRNWFVGGPDVVEYSVQQQLDHASSLDFAGDLRRVWRNAAAVCKDDAKLVIRFGGISDRKADPLFVVKDSLRESGWRIRTIRSAGTAAAGKRQADSFLRTKSTALAEYDVWAKPA